MSATAVKPVRRFPPPCWTQDEALALIQAYRDRWYALRRGYLRTADWDAVAEEVGRVCPGATPPKTSAQCRHKMEKLRQRYRAEKQRALSFPGGRFLSTWFYFDAMEAMEKNGNGSNPDEESQPGNNSSDLKIVNLKNNQELNTNFSPVPMGLNPGRGIRFKPAMADRNLVTLATRSNNSRYIQDNGEEFEDESLVHEKLGKTHKFPSQNYAPRFQSEYHNHDGVNFPHGFRVKPPNFQDLEQPMYRPRKISKIDSNPDHGYWEENDQDQEEDDLWVKMPYKNSSNPNFDANNGSERLPRDDDAIGQMVSSIKVLADGFVKMEKMKMDMVREIEKMRMEAEMKRNELILESQKQIVDAFVKGLAGNKKQRPKTEEV